MSDDKTRLSLLIQEMLDGRLDRSQRSDLLQRVESDESARQEYLDQIGTHAALKAVLADCLPHDSDAVNDQPVETTPRSLSRWYGIAIAVASLAAAILVCVLVWSNSQRDFTAAPVHFAEITDLREASFGLCDFATTPGASLTEGTLRLQAGEVDLKFACGAKMTLVAPAVLHLKTPMLVGLESGRLSCDVPEDAIGFQVESTEYTVTDLGTRFELEVGQRQWVRVLEGEVDVEPRESTVVRLVKGQTASVTKRRVTRHEVPLQEIPLGNLFDDPKGTPLRTAIDTDTRGATAQANGLGVERVVRAEEVPGVIQEIAPGVRIDLESVGWCEMSSRGVVNDSWCPYTLRPIQTRETRDTEDDLGEQGIGIHACQFVTFDIREIREAGSILKRPLAFVADRVGVNWDRPDDSQVNLAVIASNGREVTAAWVNGNRIEVNETDGVATLGEELPRHAWRFSPVSFFCPLNPGTRYVTLISSAPKGAKLQDAHGVFSGARLKVGSVRGWSSRDGHLVQMRDSADQRFLFGDVGWGDYEFSFEAKKRFGKEGFLVIVRCRDANEFCWVNIGGWQNQRTQVERKLVGERRQHPIGPESDFVIEQGRWYQIRVRCEGHTLSLFVDDELVLQYEDDGNMQSQGKVGIGTWSTSAVFRNVEVKSLDGDHLFDALAGPEAH
ncbi:family 16 glycoside hydrolase [Novipirellula artificiosorum]|uniref:Extracellular exo-alpha-L-arabinofuranosidase n=1 Tax=Novipirellula artificiosorum TaxID=2528016 RepID=A0A5C6DRQ5_9BACT|nr:family 16 glycoside hydrolase [Novipirellula artificiosorum]TWU37439.1 Extracellular exo-alpha-L-arabinofuranosidase precursor [Novipirellula artificiosorum]